MIQRIQSLYFFMASLTMMVLSFSPLYTTAVGTSKFTMFVGGLLETQGENEEILVSQPSIFAVNILLVLMPLIAIFLFKNRKLQLRLSSSAMLSYTAFVILLAGVSNESLKSIQGFTGEGNFGWGLALPFVAIIFLFLANKGIRNDENLVRSADRLR